MKHSIQCILIISLFLFGCRNGTDESNGWLDDSVAFKKRIAHNFGFHLIAKGKERYWYVLRDDNGLTYYIKIAYAPQNEKTIVYDSQGRTLVVAGRASECLYNDVVKYLYSKNGDIEGYVSLSDNIDLRAINIPIEYQQQDIDSIIDARYSRWPYEYYEKAGTFNTVAAEVADLALTRNYDAPYYMRFYLDRNENGQVISVYDPIFHLRYDAPDNGYIEHIVRESPDFWYSDISGGNIEILFVTHPLDPNNKYFESDTMIWFRDYSKYKEKYYPYL